MRQNLKDTVVCRDNRPHRQAGPGGSSKPPPRPTRATHTCAPRSARGAERKSYRRIQGSKAEERKELTLPGPPENRGSRFGQPPPALNSAGHAPQTGARGSGTQEKGAPSPAKTKARRAPLRRGARDGGAEGEDANRDAARKSRIGPKPPSNKSRKSLGKTSPARTKGPSGPEVPRTKNKRWSPNLQNSMLEVNVRTQLS